MTRIITHCIFLLLFSFPSTYAQVTISGELFSNGEPIPYASLLFVNKGDSKKYNSLTDSLGVFKISIPVGSYSLTISAANFLTDTISLEAFTDMHLKRIEMRKKITNLSEISVIANKKIFEKKTDRFVFNFSSSNLIAPVNAWEVLKVTPLVNTTEFGGLSISNSTKAIVFIDEKPLEIQGEALTAYLKSLPAGSIDRVEIITIPSSKYATDGNASIINLVLKTQKKDGYQIDLSLYDKQATYNTPSANLNFTIKYKNLSFYTISGYANQNFLFTQASDVSFDKTDSLTLFNLNQTSRRLKSAISLSNRTGIAYQLSKKQNIDFVFDWLSTSLLRTSSTKSDYGRNKIIDSINQTTILNDETSKLKNFILNYQLKGDTIVNQNLSIALATLYYRSNKSGLNETNTISSIPYTPVDLFNNTLAQKYLKFFSTCGL